MNQQVNKMKILVVAATSIEVNLFINQIKENSFISHQIDLLISGIGLTATTYSLQKKITTLKPDLIIQAGVGGCFDKTIKLGQVFVVKKETIADQSVVELNSLKTLFDLKLVPQNQYPYKKGWLINQSEVLKKVKLKKVTGISVNEITTSKQKVNFYQKAFNPVVESMEGAALHYVCLQEKIPFIQLRSVSNYVAERNKKNWNMKESIINLNNELCSLLNQLS